MSHPVPTEFKKLRGNPGKRAINKDEPVLDLIIPEPPEELTGVALKMWNYFSRLLFGMRVLSEADTTALVRLCHTYAELEDARLRLYVYGSPTYTVENRDGTQRHYARPEVKIIADCDRRLRSYLEQFGLTPVARTRLKVIDDPNDKKTESKFFN